MKLSRFLAHVDALAGPVLATVSGRVAAELIVGFSDGVSLIAGGHDLGNYLFPVAQRPGPQRVAAIFGRKIHGPSSPAVGPAQPDTAEATPQFSTRMVGSYVRKEWKQKLHDRLRVQAATIDPGPVGLTIALTTGPGRNWASLWKPLIDAFGPGLGEDPTRPFHPHDDRIVSLGPASHHRHRRRTRRDYRRLVDQPVANPAASRRACPNEAGPANEREYAGCHPSPTFASAAQHHGGTPVTHRGCQVRHAVTPLRQHGEVTPLVVALAVKNSGWHAAQ